MIRSVSIAPRRYRDKQTGEWKDSGSFRPGDLSALILALLASLPDATIRVEHVSWSEETDGVIVAVRWMLEGTTRPGGLLGDVPAGKQVAVMSMSHLRFSGVLIVEEWTIFDEVAVLAQAYRQ